MSWLHRFIRPECLGYIGSHGLIVLATQPERTHCLGYTVYRLIVLATQPTQIFCLAIQSTHDRVFAIQSTLIRCLGDTVNTGSCLRYTVYTNLPPWLYSQHRPTSWLNSQHKLVSWLRGNLTIRYISSAIPTLQFLPRPLKSLMSRVILSGHWLPYNMVTFHIGQ